MARILPWNIEREPLPKKPRAPPAARVKQEKLPPSRDTHKSDDEKPTIGRGRASEVNVTPKSSRRTPSSSPVRGPPPVELMHEGFDRDDAYIMVEDEFQTVAQSYTAHLHHAEYKRLVKQARQVPPKALPEPTSPMSKQAKNRLRIAALEKQIDTLRQVTGKATLGDDEDEDKVADLWSGTSLAPLMASGSQQKRSLVGLEGISSSTKAGLGVTRSQNSRNDAGMGDDDTVVMDTTEHTGSRSETGTGNTARHRTPENKVIASEADVEATMTSAPIERDVPARRPASVASKPVERRMVKRKFVFDFDDGFDNSEPVPKPSKTAPTLNGNGLLKRKADREQDRKKSRLDEVPMWL